MRAGKLRHRITFMERVITRDPDNGEELVSWNEYGKLWAKLEPLSGRDLIAAQAAHSEITARITVRFNADIVPTMYAVYRGKEYTIHAVLPDPRSGLEWLTLPVSEGVRHGG